MYSDGKTGCKRCPPNTTPNYGYQILHWTEMPKMMSAACMEIDGKKMYIVLYTVRLTLYMQMNVNGMDFCFKMKTHY